MKTKIIILLLMILSLFSCNEDEQIRMGIMDCKVEVSKVMPTAAIITYAIPNDKENILVGGYGTSELILSDKPLNSSQNIWNESESYFDFSKNILSVDTQNNGLQYLVYGLYPNTTYYILVRTPMNHFGYYSWYDGWRMRSSVYYTNDSFTTAKAGDYSGLGEFKCELVDYRYTDYADNEYTLIKLCYPKDISFSWGCKLYASPDMNMESPIEGMKRGELYDKYNIGNNEVLFSFPLLEKKKYYFQIYGEINFNSANFGYCRIDVDNSLDITNIPD